MLDRKTSSPCGFTSWHLCSYIVLSVPCSSSFPAGRCPPLCLPRLATGQIPFQLVVQRAHGVSYNYTPSLSCFVLVKTNCFESSCLERKLFTPYLFSSPLPQTLILKNWWYRDCILKKSNLDRESSGPRSRILVSVPDLLLAAKLLCLPVSFSPSALRMKGLSKGQDAEEREDAQRNPCISARGRKNPPDEVKQNKARKAFS